MSHSIQNQNNESQQVGNFACVGNDMSEFFAKARLSRREHSIVWFMVRQLNGWGITETPIQIKEFMEGTGLAKQHVISTLKSLERKGIVKKKQEDQSRTFLYAFTDDLFYRALPIKSKGKARLKLVKVTKTVTPKVTKLVTLKVTKTVTLENQQTAPVAAPQEAKDILKIYKDSSYENLNTRPDKLEEWAEEASSNEAIEREMAQIRAIIERNKAQNQIKDMPKTDYIYKTLQTFTDSVPI